MFIENVPCERTHFLWSAPGITPIQQLIIFIYKKPFSKLNPSLLHIDKYIIIHIMYTPTSERDVFCIITQGQTRQLDNFLQRNNIPWMKCLHIAHNATMFFSSYLSSAQALLPNVTTTGSIICSANSHSTWQQPFLVHMFPQSLGASIAHLWWLFLETDHRKKPRNTLPLLLFFLGPCGNGHLQPEMGRKIQSNYVIFCMSYFRTLSGSGII
jgi:hypothetical protein